MYIHIHTYIYTCIRIHIYMCKHIYVHIYIQIRTYMHIYMDTYTYAYICIHIHIHIIFHTYTYHISYVCISLHLHPYLLHIIIHRMYSALLTLSILARSFTIHGCHPSAPPPPLSHLHRWWRCAVQRRIADHIYLHTCVNLGVHIHILSMYVQMLVHNTCE